MTEGLKRLQLLKKLWVHLSPNEAFGLTSPDKIQRSGSSLGEVRRKELANLLLIEKQLHELRRGYAKIEAGKLIQSSEFKQIAEVRYSSIIEHSGAQRVELDSLPDISRMLDNAEQVSRYDALERMLRLQKLYLLAERIILGQEALDVDLEPLDRRWFTRWKLKASEISNGPLQHLWAEMLVQELEAGGSSSLRTLEQLSLWGIEDAENLQKMASWVCGDFVHRGVFEAQRQAPTWEILRTMEDQGILRGVYGKVLCKSLYSESHDYFLSRITIGSMIFELSAPYWQEDIQIPAFLLTQLGKQLVRLVSVPIDPRYREAILQDFKVRGISIKPLNASVQKISINCP